jgi:plasmid stabilization system protein ParE
MTAAAEYYQTQSMGLGEEFLFEVERSIAAIASHPKAAPKVKKEIRRRLLKRFPFGILYVATVDEIVVLAIMHLRRRPGYWQDRLGSSKQSQ